MEYQASLTPLEDWQGFHEPNPAKDTPQAYLQAGLPQTIGCHTFRATGITTYLQNGATIEHARQIANHD